ncbi:hypothetical protein FANTH_1453 [Fusarium anthophilum]|uniref:Uncharacterized protein n=1 Tax=Fusarium anthophilum TaxID=48485 RepID=A0A8H5EB39_9HYPO|nr:hypothetical protein FANTH_1453 [Fusarium anthophilum]
MSIILGQTRCDGCQVLFTDSNRSAIRFYCGDYPTGDWKAENFSLQRPSTMTILPNTRCTFLHEGCFRYIVVLPNGQRRSQPEINCFGRALGWRKLDLMRIFPKVLDIPGPRRISPPAIATVAAAAQLEYFQRLPIELVDMVRSYCPDAYFWNMVQLLDSKDFISTGQSLHNPNLSRLWHWKRGDAAPRYRRRLKDPECLRISLDSDGICEIQRLRDHPRPPKSDPLVKFRKYAFASKKELGTVDACF